MKKLIAILIAICTTIGLAAQNNVVDAANFGRYAADNAKFPPLKKGEKRVVFLGNSITEGWQNQRSEFFRDNGYIGRGISGQTSYTMLLRFRNDVLNLNPTAVVLNVGTNDIALNDGEYDEDRTFGNIVSMAELARANNVQMILTTLLPAAAFPWRPAVTDAADKIESLNKRLRAYAAANSIPFADYYTPLVHPGDRALPVTFSDDGVHPNLAGYAIMEPVIQAILKKL